MRFTKNTAISRQAYQTVEGTRLALRAVCMKRLVVSGLSFLAYLTLLLQPCVAGDARVFVPEDPNETPRAVHAERSGDLKVRLLYDSPTDLLNRQVEATVHYRILSIRPDMLNDINFNFGIASGIGGGASGWIVEAGGEIDGLNCDKGGHCLLYGSELGADADLTMAEIKPDPLVTTQAVGITPGVGYLFSRNNKTFIVKLMGGAALHAPVSTERGGELYADVGAKARFLFGNKFTVVAEILQHFGLFDSRNKFTEGRLQLKWRFWHVPIDRFSDAIAFKGASLQFDIRAYDGDQVTRADYNNGQVGVIHHTTVTAGGGLSIEY